MCGFRTILPFLSTTTPCPQFVSSIAATETDSYSRWSENQSVGVVESGQSGKGVVPFHCAAPRLSAL
jgi:hypothetical protein